MSDERVARALEAILGQLTFTNQFIRKLVEIKDLPDGTNQSIIPEKIVVPAGVMPGNENLGVIEVKELWDDAIAGRKFRGLVYAPDPKNPGATISKMVSGSFHLED